jgi:two-component system, OmpR family, sensor kinase
MASEIAGPNSLLASTSSTAARDKLQLRTGLAGQLLVLIGVGLLLLGAFVVRQTRNDLVRQVDDTLRSSLRGRVRDNKGLDRTTAKPSPAPQNTGTNPTPQDPTATATAPPATSPLRAKPLDPDNPIKPINPSNSIKVRPDASGNRPPRPEDAANQDLPPSATVTFDAANQQLRALGSGTNGTADPLPKLDQRSLRNRIGEFSTVPAVDGSIRFRVLPAALGDGRLLVEAAPLRLVDAAVADLVRTLIIGSLVVMGFAGIALYFLLRRALRPLGQIATAAGVVATGNTGHGVAVKTPYRELDQLSQSLDAMVTKLGRALDGQRRALETQAEATKRLRAFVSDASHELQTPVTSIRGWAELYRRGGLAGHEALNSAMCRIENEAARMGRLVDDLLVLARVDEQRTLIKQPVDLASVCADAIEAARVIAPDRAVLLTVEPSRFVPSPDSDVATSTPFVVGGDPDQLRQVFDNLLANIRIHTPPGTGTFVHIENVESNVVVIVRDNGEGFDPDQLGHAFNRFWRADQSNRKSHGLGLAIVHAIVTSHGGTVSAVNINDGETQNVDEAGLRNSTRGALVTVGIPALE